MFLSHERIVRCEGSQRIGGCIDRSEYNRPANGTAQKTVDPPPIGERSRVGLGLW